MFPQCGYDTWWYGSPRPRDPNQNWPAQIGPYVNNRQIFSCPSRRWEDVNYAANNELFDWFGRGPLSLGSIVRDPASVVLLCDVGAIYCTSTYAGAMTWPYGPLGGEWYTGYTPGDLHNGGANHGFTDGHAKWLKMPTTYMCTQTYNGVTWNPTATDGY